MQAELRRENWELGVMGGDLGRSKFVVRSWKAGGGLSLGAGGRMTLAGSTRVVFGAEPGAALRLCPRLSFLSLAGSLGGGAGGGAAFFGGGEVGPRLRLGFGSGGRNRGRRCGFGPGYHV